MKVLIVEDEKLAFERLERMLKTALNEPVEMVSANSIQKAIETIHHQSFDLAFFDIELSDGLSFEIFEKTEVNCPVIFTTAYHQYALQAFKHNSVDYLLKPIDKIELATAIEKYKTYWRDAEKSFNIEKTLFVEFKKLLHDDYKKRFVVKIGAHIKLIESKDIQLIYSLGKASYIRVDKDYLVDYSLDKLSEMLSPKKFFRINRNHIIAMDSIKDIIAYSNSRLKVVLKINYEEELIVSREKVSWFKTWLEGD